MSQDQDRTTSLVFRPISDEVAQTAMVSEFEPASPRFIRSPGPAPPSPFQPHFSASASVQAGDEDEDENEDDDVDMCNLDAENDWDRHWEIDSDGDFASDPESSTAAELAEYEELEAMNVELEGFRETMNVELDELEAMNAELEELEAELSRPPTPDGSSGRPFDVDNWEPQPALFDATAVTVVTSKGDSSYCLCDERTGNLGCGQHCRLRPNSANTVVKPPVNNESQQFNNAIQETVAAFTLLALHAILAPTWISEALRFVSHIPRDAMAWLAVVPDNDRIFEICDEVSLWQQETKRCGDDSMDWYNFFDDCLERLDSITNRAVHNLFSLVVLVSCSLAIANGCPYEFARIIARSVLERSGHDALEMSDYEIDQTLRAAIMTLPFYREIVRFLGPKGFELVLHMDILPLMRVLDDDCLAYIYDQLMTAIPKPIGLYAEFSSTSLSVQSLVVNLFNSVSGGRQWA
ncbi:hypothetical protein B0J13DRAFT_183136 [Dactylonectria estremocensis]|uniref:Uncharacterized protein n=1 Tax=Dactylonectria estremocensis TaxID=1079267 RepID=A0A9P9FDL1_9HYPO|nr:hypothetical protein B0J13DRAFT_183136 [Dactylonectria estremocensis]